MSSSADGPSEGDREDVRRSGWSRFGSLPIWARLALLTAAGLISLIGSSLFLSSALNQTAERTTQMQGLHDSAAAAAEAHVTFGELRYWLTDLSVSLLITSERSADAARARLEPQLERLADARPEAVALIRAEVDAYVSKAIEAADAYTDGNRVIGNTLLAQARGHSAAVDAALDGLVAEFHSAAVAERESVVARAEDSANTALMIVAVLTLVGLGLTGIVFRSIVQPLRRLNAAVAGFARGRYDGELPADGDHEFGAMARTLRAFRENAIERERLEAEAERQHNMVATAIETISDGFVLYDEDTKVRLANSKYREMLGEIAPMVQPGVALSEILTAQAQSNLAELEGQPAEQWVDERVARHRDVPQSVDERMLGDTWVRVSKRDTPDGGKVAVYTDITEIKRREGEALAARERFEDAIEAISSGFALFDAEDRLVIWNSRFRDYFARMADVFVPGTTFREMLSASIERGLFPEAEGDKEEFLENLLSERARGIGKVRENRLSDGLWLQICDHRTKDGGLVSIYTDVTDLKQREAEITKARDEAEAALADLRKAQERLIQAEKMASLGQLTAGIAHEIKNPLNFVNNFAKLSDELLEELSDTLEEPIKSLDDEARDDAEDLLSTVRENMGKINEHGKRADSIVKNMLLHSREGPSERQPARVNAIAEEALNLAYHGARAENPKFNIEMAKELNANPDEVVCFPQDVMRVFLNLITNGMYAANKRALEEGNGFSPTIAISSRNLDDAVEIEVRDNGKGIDPEMRDRIFTPFFTTKPAGEGTGLGLSLSYDIVVKQHGGELSVDSEPGSHTAFRVTLPQGAAA